ncbi:hypothetical protein LZ554_007115 [Drepanopeziza brunnea f. sp. 'monogermtubi']|nr:hypothetical protein LZ554_007115 [Drepanopeziza brunnea f. sp. 'monogermtubi']
MLLNVYVILLHLIEDAKIYASEMRNSVFSKSYLILIAAHYYHLVSIRFTSPLRRRPIWFPRLFQLSRHPLPQEQSESPLVPVSDISFEEAPDLFDMITRFAGEHDEPGLLFVPVEKL